MSDSTVSATQSGTFKIGGELEVNRLGYGTMRLTGDGIWGPPKDHDEAIRVLKRSVELGVNFIDTAVSYGPYVAEDLIAEALYPYADDLVIATKGGLQRTGPGEWPMDGSPDQLRADLEGSLKRLKVDTIDLWQLHRIDPKVPLAEQIGVAKEFQDEGKIRFFGLSEVSVADLAEVQETIDVVTVQNLYNVANRGAQELVDVCTDMGIGFIPWFPLASGDLSNQAAALAEHAKAHGVSESQLALAWLLHVSDVMLPIPGTSSVAHLEENIGAAAIALSQEDIDALA